MSNNKRRFFSEYAVQRRVSHNHSVVSIKDFSYLNATFKGLKIKNPENVGISCKRIAN